MGVGILAALVFAGQILIRSAVACESLQRAFFTGLRGNLVQAIRVFTFSMSYCQEVKPKHPRDIVLIVRFLSMGGSRVPDCDAREPPIGVGLG